MSSRSSFFFLILLLALSFVLRSPLLFLVAALSLMVAGSSALWGRYCLAGVTYERRLSAARLLCGEEADLWVEIVNAKPLPLAWLKTEDEVPMELQVQKLELSYASKPNRRMLSNLFSMRWYERVRRHYRFIATQRGVYEFGPVRISSGDIFGFRSRNMQLTGPQIVLVYPKVVPLEDAALQAARPLGESRTLRRVVADPLRLAGTRDYQPGDSIRHLHWKATAHRGALQTKMFEPSASHQLVLFLNNQTRERAYEGVIGDLYETVIVVAASVARAALEARHPVGLYTNGSVRDSERRLRLPPSRHTAQTTRILEALAQLTFFTLMPFEKLLQLEARQLPFGATVIAVSALVNEPILSALLDLQATGHPVSLIAVGTGALPPLPPELPVYSAVENWTVMQSIRLQPARVL